MEVITVGLLGVVGALLALQLKAIQPAYGNYLIFGVGILVALYTVGVWSGLLQRLEQVMAQLPVDRVYVTTLLKMMGIAYIAQLCSGLCKDAGFSSVASQIETFGKLTMLSLSLPVVLTLLDTVRTFLQEGL